MIKIYYILFFASCFFCSNLTAQDLKLWYSKPAVKWTEALPIGNGRIGAMVFGGVQQDRIQFNEETLWTGSPRNYNKPDAYKYLDTIRQLLFLGKQKDAEAIAEQHFLGEKSNSGDKENWIKNIFKNTQHSAENFNDKNWDSIQVPHFNGWESVGLNDLDGAVWLRTTFELPNNWSLQNIVLDLNRIRDYDYTYINGTLVGSQQNNEPRKYIVPSNVLHSGTNSIAILVLNFSDKGGLVGFKDTSKQIGYYPQNNENSKLPFNKYWKYFVANTDVPPVGVYQASYQPFGDLFLNFNDSNNITNYKRELNLEDATVTTTYNIDSTSYIRKYFVSKPNQALVVHLSSSKKNKISFNISLSALHKNYQVKTISNNTISLFVQIKNGALHGNAYCKIELDGGTLVNKQNTLIISNANAATIYLTAATNFVNYKDLSKNAELTCKNSLNAIAANSYNKVLKNHIDEYKSLFNSFKLNFGKSNFENIETDKRLALFNSNNDPSFVALYVQYARYLAISSSRKGTMPANLQGIWNDLLNPPWGSKYTTNINAEMNYWGSEVLNLSSTHESLFSLIKDVSIAGKQTAKAYYHAPGFVLHHNTDLWRGTAPINAANHGIWVTGGAWLCQHLWEHYLFTQNKQFLKDTAYPIMKQAALFFNSFLIKDISTGYLISTPSNSPEQGGLVAGPTMDHQIIRALFYNVIHAASILKIDANFKNILQNKVLQIAPNKIGKFGQLQEWMKDVDDTTNKHRHISHLWGLYPGNEINFETTPQFLEAAKQSLLYRGDAATGWSIGWKTNCWARLKDGDHAFRMIKLLLTPANNSAGSYVNLFDAHPPFQIDGNFGGAAGIAEMLLQSHTQFIDILPAVPTYLPNGEVDGICARGGFVLSFKWFNGLLVYCNVVSNKGGILNLRYKDKVVQINTKPNTKYNFNNLLEFKN